MNTKKKHLMHLIFLLSIILVCTVCANLYGLERFKDDRSQPRADLIVIDFLKAFGPLEKQPVEFLHDAHTQALAKKKLDCTACHLADSGRISPKFKRLKDTDRIGVMNLYHQECLSCHGEMKVAKEKTGPVECDGCHREKFLYASSRQPMGLDNSLHYRHVEAQEKKCDRCHHEYDEKGKKLYYAKGKEGTCRYCHKPQAEGKVISMPEASHIACVNCHLQAIAKNLSSGPVNCLGCHDAAAQEKIKKISPVPRMERNQPDIVVLKTAPKDQDDILRNQNRMNFVPFDHQAHEAYNDTCRVCHHDTLKPCNQCHTLAGAPEGKNVNLEDAMHRPDAAESCTGCHRIKQESSNCAGCHAGMLGTRRAEDDSCLQCHMMPKNEAVSGLSTEGEKSLAEEMLKSRKTSAGMYPETDIPEKVIIKNLSKEYEAVDFPHRKIVNALVGNMKDSKLAGYFHSPEGTICKGCHHNSPAAKKPPQCANCHGKTFDEKDPFKPGIMAAYHLQCIGCHQIMKITKVEGCTDCHKEKK
jgi:hypothetical protein